MRLSQQEIEAFVEVLSTELKPGEGSLYLYGSRIDDTLKGGDIDLVLILKSDQRAKTLSSERSRLVNEFKKRIGDRRIDFSVIAESTAASDAFFQQALKKSALLKNW